MPAGAVPRPLWRRLHLPDRYAPWGMLFILPAVLFFAVFKIIPIAASGWVSLHEWNLIGPMTWVGADNYVRALGDRRFLEALGRSFLYAGVVVAGTLALALLVAVLLDQGLRFSAWYRAAFFSPMLMSWVVISIVWKVMYAPTFGLFSNLADLVGLPYAPPLTSSVWALAAIMAMGIWHALGFYMVVFLSGLQAIPPHLYEAAGIDGASGSRSFRHITLPLLVPTILFAVVTATIETLQVFVQVYIMTRGGPADSTRVGVYYIYQAAFYEREMGYGAGLGLILLAIVLVITLVYLKAIKMEQYY
jgi:multiple sugar transport system permease protein